MSPTTTSTTTTSIPSSHHHQQNQQILPVIQEKESSSTTTTTTTDTTGNTTTTTTTTTNKMPTTIVSSNAAYNFEEETKRVSPPASLPLEHQRNTNSISTPKTPASTPTSSSQFDTQGLKQNSIVNENTPLEDNFKKLVSSEFSGTEEEGILNPGDWSPEIPFRDLNDLRLSVDDDPVLVKQRVDERFSPSHRQSVHVEEGMMIEMEPRSEGRCSFQARDSIPGVDVSFLQQFQGKMGNNSIVSLQRGRVSTLGVPSVTQNNNYKTTVDDAVTTLATQVMTVSQQVDIILDQYIEIESNKRMMEQNVNWFCLNFKLKPMELQFHQIKDGVFKSNAVCVGITWFLLMSSQLLVLPNSSQALLTFSLSSVIIIFLLVVTMASEFHSSPLTLKTISQHLENKRSCRNLLACLFILTIFTASSSVLVSNYNWIVLHCQVLISFYSLYL